MGGRGVVQWLPVQFGASSTGEDLTVGGRGVVRQAGQVPPANTFPDPSIRVSPIAVTRIVRFMFSSPSDCPLQGVPILIGAEFPAKRS